MSDDNTRLIRNAMMSGSVQAAASYAVLSYVIPIGVPLLTIALGYIQGLPWMHIIVAASFVFACITTGLLRYYEWHDQRRVQGKLNFRQPRFCVSVRGDGYALGFVVDNHAHFPIEFRVEEMRTRIGDKVPVVTTGRKPVYEVPPGGNGFYDDHLINQSWTANEVADGFLEASLAYGRPGNLKHRLSIRKKVAITCNEDGKPNTLTWNDLV